MNEYIRIAAYDISFAVHCMSWNRIVRNYSSWTGKNSLLQVGTEALKWKMKQKLNKFNKLTKWDLESIVPG